MNCVWNVNKFNKILLKWLNPHIYLVEKLNWFKVSRKTLILIFTKNLRIKNIFNLKN